MLGNVTCVLAGNDSSNKRNDASGKQKAIATATGNYTTIRQTNSEFLLNAYRKLLPKTKLLKNVL